MAAPRVKKTPESAYFAYQREVFPAPFAGPVADIYFGVKLALNNHAGLEADTDACRLNDLSRNDLPADAIAYKGRDRGLDRGPTETDAQYLARLRDAWTAWEFAGTETAIISQLALIGVTATIVENGDWDWDGNTGAWARFWVLIESSPWSGSTWQWGDGTRWGDGSTWGTTASVEEVETVRRIVRQWKPAHCFCDSIIVVVDPVTWAAEQPDGTWGDWANRSLGAAYWNG